MKNSCRVHNKILVNSFSDNNISSEHLNTLDMYERNFNMLDSFINVDENTSVINDEGVKGVLENLIIVVNNPKVMFAGNYCIPISENFGESLITITVEPYEDSLNVYISLMKSFVGKNGYKLFSYLNDNLNNRESLRVVSNLIMLLGKDIYLSYDLYDVLSQYELDMFEKIYLNRHIELVIDKLEIDLGIILHDDIGFNLFY